MKVKPECDHGYEKYDPDRDTVILTVGVWERCKKCGKWIVLVKTDDRRCLFYRLMRVHDEDQA